MEMASCESPVLWRIFELTHQTIRYRIRIDFERLGMSRGDEVIHAPTHNHMCGGAHYLVTARFSLLTQQYQEERAWNEIDVCESPSRSLRCC